MTEERIWISKLEDRVISMPEVGFDEGICEGFLSEEVKKSESYFKSEFITILQRDKGLDGNESSNENQSQDRGVKPSLVSQFTKVKRDLKKFNLSGKYSEVYVLNEAYIRGIRLIRKGEKIHNPLAWIRTTCVNIIRELSREEKKNLDLTIDVPDVRSADAEFESDFSQKFMLMKRAFEQLTPVDQEILTLKVVNGLAWKKVAEELSQKGVNLNGPALRKRKERAIKALRQIYCQVSKE